MAKRKKKRSPAQKAATKRMLAGLAKSRSKNASKRKTKKKIVRKTAKKKITKRKVAKRKVIRKGARKTKVFEYYVVTSSSSHNYKYFDGERFTSYKNRAALYRDLKTVKRIAQLVAERDPRKIYIRTVELKT